MVSFWVWLLLLLHELDTCSAILLPENVIPSIPNTQRRRQATSQCSQTVIPITRTCSTPNPAKRYDPTALPAAGLVRDAPTPTCSQIYTTSEKCSDASGPEYPGTIWTIPPSNTIPGLPGGTTGTVETAALSAGVCPGNNKSPWEVQMTPELRDRILDIADDICKNNGNPVRARQGSDSLNHPQCNFHALGSKPQQDFIASIKAEIQPKVYYPIGSPSDLDCLPEGWAEYPAHEQLVADVVAGFIGYAFDLGWNLWETFNVPAEFGSSALSESSTSSSSSGSTIPATAGNPPVKSTSTSTTTTARPGPGPKQSSTSTTSTSSADACPTDITIDPNEDQGQDGPTPTDQFPIVPAATITTSIDLPCQAHLDPHNEDCNVCTCAGKDTTITVPLSHMTYATPVSGSLITTSDACWYTSWPDTKTVSTTSCADGDEVAASKSIASVMSSIRNHLTDLSDYTPGAPARTCSPDPNHKMPICDLKIGGHDNLPYRYCDCPGPITTISTPYSTTSTSLVSCDPKLGTVTHLDVCPWTTTPPESMRISTIQHGSAYPGGTLPPIQTATPSCVPNDKGSAQAAYQGSYVRATAKGFCRRAIRDKLKVGPGTGNTNKLLIYNDARRGRNSIGNPEPKKVALFVQWDKRACPAGFDDDHYEFRDFDDCVEELTQAAFKCKSKQVMLRPHDFGSIRWFFYGGGRYANCLWWEISTSDKFGS